MKKLFFAVNEVLVLVSRGGEALRSISGEEGKLCKAAVDISTL
jgi:hypothetical protein